MQNDSAPLLIFRTGVIVLKLSETGFQAIRAHDKRGGGGEGVLDGRQHSSILLALVLRYSQNGF